MSTQQDIYATGSKNRPLMLNKDNYVPWSSRIIRYARSRPNGKMIVDPIENGPYVRRMIATPGEPDLPVPEIWERVRQMMKGSDIGDQEKKVKLFNEWEKFTYTDGESIESYYHRFMQLMNDLKRNKHFPENIAANLKFLNNLQPEWKRHVTIVRQTKNLHETDFTQIYEFLKMNREENSFNFPITHKDQSSSSTHSQQSFPINNKYNPQPSLNQNFMQPLMTSIEDINGPTEATNAALILFVKAFQLSALTNNSQRTSSNPPNRQIALPVRNMSQDRQIQNVGGNESWDSRCSKCNSECGCQSGGNQNGLVVVPGIANQSGTGNVVAARTEGVQLQAEEFDFMAAAGDLDKIEEVNANCILMTNLQQASTSGTQHDKALVYDTNGSAKVHLNDNCYDNEIFNMFTQDEQYTDLLELIPKLQLVPQNDNHVLFFAPSMVQSGGIVETSFAPNEETRAHQETVYRNLVDQIAKVNMINCNMRATNAKLKSELARYKIQEQRVEIRVFVPQTTKSKEELFLSNVSNMVTVSKTISIPNEDLSDDTTPSVAQKFLNEVKSSLVTLQCVVKQKITLEVHNWSSSTHKEVHRIISHEIAPIINQVDARVQNFEIQFLQEAAKFVRDFKSLAKEANESLDKQKSLELEIKRPLKVSVTHDIMSIMQNGFVDAPFDLQTELDRMKEKLKLCIIKRKKNKLSFGIIGLLHTSRTRRPQPKGKTRNAMVPSASKISEVKKNVTVEEHRRTLLLSKNQKPCHLNHTTGNIKLLINFVWKFLGTVRFGNDHIATILGYGDLKWGNITITRVYFVEGLGHNLFSIGQICNADLKVAFRRNTCFIRDLDGVDLLKGNRSTNLYTINLYDMASASPICLMARATPTMSWLWHQ
nr:integrase, catalytic region, zinc finger, CCHC-type, peptidase aspartic, catalytic [Tanacetum cinerariifolium]